MNREHFVDGESIVRRIWGNSDTILFIFAGASAEFALNKAVDWLYFTGRLPNDPLGRLFSTVSYAKAIVFSEKDAALRAIESMRIIHANVEAKRGQAIPDWAYRDVLFLLIDYSIRAYELLYRKLTREEKVEVFEVFLRIGTPMGIKGLPQSFSQYEIMREQHLAENLRYGDCTTDLFRQYRKHLGNVRYRILLEAQAILVPHRVRQLLTLHRISLLQPLVVCYKILRAVNVEWFLKELILPSKYKDQIKGLDIQSKTLSHGLR